MTLWATDYRPRFNGWTAFTMVDPVLSTKPARVPRPPGPAMVGLQRLPSANSVNLRRAVVLGRRPSLRRATMCASPHGEPPRGKAYYTNPALLSEDAQPSTLNSVQDIHEFNKTELLYQLERDGFAVAESVLDPVRCASLRAAILGKSEVGGKNVFRYNGSRNARVWCLLNEGIEFSDLALEPLPLTLARQVLGGAVLLSNLTANIVGYGSQKVDHSFRPSLIAGPWPDYVMSDEDGYLISLHTDQGYLPGTRPIPYAVVAVWVLDCFSHQSGGLIVVPGSHRLSDGKEEELLDLPLKIVEAPVGSVILVDGRTWHGTGVGKLDRNQRVAVLTYLTRPVVRSQENWFLSLDRSVLARRPELAELVGFTAYHSLGMVEGAPVDFTRA